VSNTIASNNGSMGILVQPTGSAVVTGVLSKVTANNTAFGIFVDGSFTTGASLNVTIDDSEASNNVNIGVFAQSSRGNALTAVMVRNVVASNNGTGLVAQGGAILRVAHSVVTGNGTGVFVAGTVVGILDSYGDNDIDGNTTDNTGVLTVIPTH
jgi:Periplasmic copper-binding protein (NosD)